MASNNLLTKLEDAAKNVYVATASAAIASFTGLSTDAVSVPCVVFSAQQGDESVPGSYQFRCTLTITVKSNADSTTITQHRDYVSDAFDLFMADDIDATLSGATGAQTDFTVTHVMSQRNISERIEERMHVSEMQVHLIACANDI